MKNLSIYAIRIYRPVWLFFLISVLSCHPESTQSKKSPSVPNSIPKWEVYGLPDIKDNIRAEVAKSMGFTFEIAGDCTVTDSLINAVEHTNKITDRILSSRYGKNWQILFEQKVDSMYKIDTMRINMNKPVIK